MLTKVAAKTAAEICGNYGLSKEAQQRLRADLTPPQFIEKLVEVEQYQDVFDFLAHGLPKEDAIWWACLSIRHAQGPKLPPKELAALKAVVEWVVKPDDPKRRAAYAAGEQAGLGTPVGRAAIAVFGSGGSLGPPDLPELAPEPYLTAKAVSGSVALASMQGDPNAAADIQRDLVDLGIAVAEGKVPWPPNTKEQSRANASGKRR
jgi:hypothetical protein